jgi:hypothetical protein
MKYNIGDVVWYASMKTIKKTETCPDCFGQLALTVIKGDGSKVSIPCACGHGCEPPRGYYTFWAYVPDVKQVTIQRIEIDGTETKYGHSEKYQCSESELFNNKEDAEKRALELAAEHEQEELAKIHQKDRHNRTWAWHVRYHREELKEAQRRIEYHSAKLNVAKAKAKTASE